jgi:hypothetical protein
VEQHAGEDGAPGSVSGTYVALPASVRIGWSGWQFVTLSATRDLIRLDAPLTFPREWVFPKEHIRCLSRYEDITFTCLRIEHTVATHPKFVALMTSRRRFEALQDGLENLGYEVRQSPLSSPPLRADTAFAVGCMSFMAGMFTPMFGVVVGCIATFLGRSSHTRTLGAAGIGFNLLLYMALDPRHPFPLLRLVLGQ